MTLEETLNELLVKLFKDILEIEAKSLITEEFKDITYNDMHIIEAVGIDEPRNMKTVAKLMSVTTGTLTKAMDAPYFPIFFLFFKSKWKIIPSPRSA
mgnify:CR=1 FL=1